MARVKTLIAEATGFSDSKPTALHLLNHPLAEHIITHLCDKTTKPVLFRNLSYQLTLLLALEATCDLETVEKFIDTPLMASVGRVLARQLVVVPILRAGLGMLQPFQDVFPDISVGYSGLERDHETAVARSYYCKLASLENARTIVVDPMLATGGSASRALVLDSGLDARIKKSPKAFFPASVFASSKRRNESTSINCLKPSTTSKAHELEASTCAMSPRWMANGWQS